MFETKQYGAYDYNYYLQRVDSFVSLDISKSGTGITVYRNGKLSIENFAILEEDLTATRREFRNKMLEVYKEGVQYTFVEDTIGSVNYKTARILYQLNSIVDDLNDMGLIDAGIIYREGNTVWKSWLEQMSGYKKKIRGEIHTKDTTVDCLRLLGINYNFGTDNESDSVGIAFGTIFARLCTDLHASVIKNTTEKIKLRDNIEVGYEIKQFITLEELTKYATKYTDFHQIDMLNETAPFKLIFRNTVNTVGDDKVFIVRIPTEKLGILLIKFNLNPDIQTSYLFVIKKGNKKNKKK